MTGSLTLGTRGSKLAMWQTQTVAEKIKAQFPDLQIVIQKFSTRGDRQTQQPLPQIGGKGLFTAELDEAIQQQKIDVAIHSLKDLPVQAADDTVIVPILCREDPRDVLIARDGATLETLPADAVVGTSSYRRQAQILAQRPDLTVRLIRGNVPTRIAKVLSPAPDADHYDAVVLAAAGVVRLGLNEQISQWIPLDTMLPAPGQAMIAATLQTGNELAASVMDSLVEVTDNRCVHAERMFLKGLGGGCSSPIAAHASIGLCKETQKELVTIHGRLGQIDGTHSVTREATGSDELVLAAELSAEILKSGGQEILDSLPSMTEHD